jgi:hypothetical protein
VRAVLFAAALALAGCGGDDEPAAGPDLGSQCGHPGDTGNSLGVGKYCQEISDCHNNTRANICSTLGSNTTFFCTFACNPNADMGNPCGENAICACGSGGAASGCGCYPTSCP